MKIIPEYLLSAILDDLDWKVRSNGDLSFFYKESFDIFKVYVPEISENGDTLRLKGWLGFFPKYDLNKDEIINSKIDIIGNYAILVRIENFPNLSITGLFQKENPIIEKEFLINLNNIVDSEIPDKISIAREEINSERGWLGMTVKFDVNNIYGNAKNLILSNRY